MSSVDRAMPRRVQGDIGEASAIGWPTALGARVWVPLFSSSHCDVIAEWDDRFERLQVKTSTVWRKGRWEIALATRGGNRSWNGVTKLLDRSRIDALFVHVGDGRRWHIPVAALDGTSNIRLGGPKYAPFEIEPGAALSPPGAGEERTQGWRR